MRRKVHVSLYVIVPIIFAGLAVLSSILTFQTAAYSRRWLGNDSGPVIWITLIEGLVAYLLGFALVRTLLHPMERFISEAKRLAALGDEDKPGNPKDVGTDKLAQFSHLFNQVTTALSKIDARQFFPEVIGESRTMRTVLSHIKKVAPSDATVMIVGESGTGKELIATSIVRHSTRADKPFIKLNCVAIPETLWESELFGHEKGSFTGATARKIGKFELAQGGTLFLDEIGDMPLATQAKILRVLQEREFERVGGTQTIKVDVRFLTATNKNLEQMVQAGEFREDLFYRLNVFFLRLPSLRERKEDIPLLVEHFLNNANKRLRVSDGALQAMLAYDWPGNVRELKNTVERAAVMAEKETIDTANLPGNILVAWRLPTDPSVPAAATDVSLDHRLARMEMEMIIDALHRCDGVQAKAARMLGIKDRSLWHRLRKYGIDAGAYKR
jgi:DNA-binding NtrC family response regulator